MVVQFRVSSDQDILVYILSASVIIAQIFSELYGEYKNYSMRYDKWSYLNAQSIFYLFSIFFSTLFCAL